MSSTQNENMQQASFTNENLPQQQQQPTMNIDQQTTTNDNNMDTDQQKIAGSMTSSSNLLSTLPENFRDLSYDEISSHMGYPQDEKQRNEHFNKIIHDANNNEDDKDLQNEKELVFFLFRKKNEEIATSYENLIKENEDLKKQNQDSQQRFSKTIDGELMHKQNQLKELFKNSKQNASYNDVLTDEMKQNILNAFQDAINEPNYERKSNYAALCSANEALYRRMTSLNSRSDFSNSINSHSNSSNNNLNSIWQKNGTLGRTNFKPMSEPKSFKQVSKPVAQFSNNQVNNNEHKPYMFDKHRTESLSKKMNSFFSDSFLEQVRKEEEFEKAKKLN